MCPRKEEEFNKILISTISEVLDFSEVVLNFLELNTAFKRDNIMKDIGALSVGLKEVFGDSGGIIEDIIAKKVHEKISIPYMAKNGTFEEKMKHAYDSYIAKKK